MVTKLQNTMTGITVGAIVKKKILVISIQENLLTDFSAAEMLFCN
jgi:hypothetical protein